MIKNLTFADVPNRERFLDSPEARNMLNTMPPDIAGKFKRCFLSGDLTGDEIKEVHSHFLEHSPIIRTITLSPSSAETFEYLYHKKPAEGEIDRNIIRLRAAIGIKQRLNALKQQLPGVIREHIAGLPPKADERLTVFNIGSGPGHDMIEVLEENRDLREIVRVVNIDPDENMLAIGEERVKELGITELFTFAPSKLGEIELGKAHMVLLIGILCPMPPAVCVKILQSVSSITYPSGIIVFNTVQTRMLMEDPLCDFIMRMADWNMDYKENKQSLDLARQAGLEPISYFSDAMDYNCIIVARNTLPEVSDRV